MKKDLEKGQIQKALLFSLALVLALIATVRAVDLNHDLLEDSWGTQYGFTSTAISSGNLAGWWQMDDSSNGDVRDRSGNALHGTMSNFAGTPFASGLFYDGLSFDSDAYASFSGSSLNLSSAFTISLWFKGGTSSNKTTLAYWEGSNGCSWELKVAADGVAQLVFVDASSNVTTVADTLLGGAVNVRDSDWHHLAAVYDTTSGTARIYVDGAEEDNASISSWTFSTASSFYLGNPPGDPPNGAFEMDEARLYNVVISAGDIVSLPPTYWDSDGDGLSNLAEQLGGTNPVLADTDGDGTNDDTDPYPTDYYNAALPTLSIVSGNHQRGEANEFLEDPLIVEVLDSSNNPLANAPVVLMVSSSLAQISLVNTGAGLVYTLNAVTDSFGRVTFYAKFPNSSPVAAEIQAIATSGSNTAKVTFSATTDDVPSSGLKLWLRGDLGVEKDGSNLVSRWIDQSGEGNDVEQGVSGSLPTFDGAGLNGKPTLGFDGNDYLYSTTLSGGSDGTVFAVYDKPVAGGDAEQKIYCGRYSLASLFPETGLAGTTNGAQIKVQTFGYFDLSYFVVGARYDSGGGWAPQAYIGNLSELIVYNRVLSSEEQIGVRRYLIQKYGFSIPKASVSKGSALISGSTDITLTVDPAFEDATIRYTLDGTEPTEDSSNPSSLTYSGTPLSISTTQTVKVKVFESGFTESETATFVYTLDTETADLSRDGLRLWLRSDVGVEKDGSDLVSRWGDQSGLGNDALSLNSINQPLWNATGLNEQATFEFDGTTDYMGIPSMSGYSAATVFTVYDKPAAGGDPAQRVYTGMYSTISLNPDTDAFESGAGVTDGPQVVVQSFGGGEFSNFKIAGGWPSSGTSAHAPFYGKLSELIVYDRALDAEEKTVIRRYLIQKNNFGIPKVTASIESTVIAGATEVTLALDPDFGDAVIRYTLDGSEPTEDSSNPSTLTYSTALSITGTTTLKVKAFESGFNPSATAEFVYTWDADTVDLPREGLIVWLRSDLGIEKNSLDKVSRWADQSGTTHDFLQREGDSQPLWRDYQIHGEPALEFDGINDYLPIKTLGTSPSTIIVVYEKTVSDYGRWLYSGIYNQVFSSPVLGGANVDIKTYPSPLSMGTFRIGASWTSYGTYTQAPFDGKIAEVLVYDRVLDEEEIEAVEYYLYLRLGIFTDKTDTDLDGVADYQEVSLGTDPNNWDSNGDGVSDGASLQLGFDPLGTDTDGDGISNTAEVATGTNPLKADSDGDGHDDDVDAYPMDPSRWELPASDPGDHTPPVLNLIKPVDAVLLP